jgi:hypothetical protein
MTRHADLLPTDLVIHLPPPSGKFASDYREGHEQDNGKYDNRDYLPGLVFWLLLAFRLIRIANSDKSHGHLPLI